MIGVKKKCFVITPTKLLQYFVLKLRTCVLGVYYTKLLTDHTTQNYRSCYTELQTKLHTYVHIHYKQATQVLHSTIFCVT